MKNLRIPQAAEYLGISKSLLDKMRCYGGGPRYAKLGASVIYTTGDLDNWLASKLVNQRKPSGMTTSNEAYVGLPGNVCA